MARLTRFQYDKKRHTDKKLLLSICIFLSVIILFFLGFQSISDQNLRRQREGLESSLNRNIVYYYTVEGHYPESLEVLKEQYGFTYDEEHFYVDYRLQGSNIFPDITIIEEVD